MFSPPCSTIKAGGVGVGLIAMVGVGGEQYRDDHRDATLDLIRALPLDRDDLVYLSPFVDGGEPSPYGRRLSPYGGRGGLTPMSDTAIRAETRRFKEELMPWARPRRVRVSNYDVREFIY